MLKAIFNSYKLIVGLNVSKLKSNKKILNKNIKIFKAYIYYIYIGI